jgi:hypothetical protein
MGVVVKTPATQAFPNVGNERADNRGKAELAQVEACMPIMATQHPAVRCPL